MKTKSMTLRNAAMYGAPLLALMAAGAFNGGTAPTTGVWTVIVTTMTDILKSDFSLGLAIAALIGAVWALVQGKGFGLLMTVISVLALAYVGPGIITSMATATPDAIAHAPAVVPAVFQR
jgi:hypothetical protein